MVVWALEHSLGGEIFVPKIPSYRIVDVAEAVGPDCKQTWWACDQGKRSTKR
jgi:FlaA1/EpsC-like NDP-sugar epimerase